MRVSWAIEAFPGTCCRGVRAPEKRKLNSIICCAGVPAAGEINTPITRTRRHYPYTVAGLLPSPVTSKDARELG